VLATSNITNARLRTHAILDETGDRRRTHTGRVIHDRDFPADPYPGAWPGYSFVHADRTGHRLLPDPGTSAGWRVESPDRRGPDLDGWLADRASPPLAARIPVLTYGSNRCPAKITWLREHRGLTGPVVLLAADTEGVAAVWAAGRRVVDTQRPATLAAAPGARERHALWLATPAQLKTLDACEGRVERQRNEHQHREQRQRNEHQRGGRYRLARLPGTVTVRTDDGTVVSRPWTYLADAPTRHPLLVDGAPVRCADGDQHTAATLTGTPAAHDGLDAATVDGTPHPDEYPAALFAYGLLQPGRAGWHLVAPYTDPHTPPRPVDATGSVHDTGLGRPALLLDPAARTPGILITFADPAAAFLALDDYEGPDYRRIRITIPTDHTAAWTYLWTGPRNELRPCSRV
jgi:gamma-glutamylcyclotransferase (GGCT)/AIG2-like uncharacterized protein YtfP